MGKIKIGIIGTGNIGHTHITAYLKNENVELYALCDIDAKRVEEVGKKYNVTRTYTDLDEMLKLEELDAVSVCTWNSAHAVCTIAALNAGKHVLCEKPMAMNAEEAKEMQAASEAAGKVLMVGFVRRFGNDCKVLKDFIATDFFGDLYYSKATYLRRNGNPGGWFGDKSRSGGGPLIDLGVHVIDLVRFIMGNPKPISVYGVTFQKLFDRRELKDKKGYEAASKKENEICDVEDLASALIRFDNGAVLSLEASFSLNMKKDEGKIELFGTKGGASLNPDIEMYTEMNGYMVDVNMNMKTALAFDGLFENEINHFVECVKDGVTCISPANQGVEIMRILDSIYESARIGHEIILD